VRVLTAVLANPRQVSLDVAGIVRRSVEWRRQEQDQPRIAPQELGTYGFHRLAGTGGLARAGQNGPRLGQRIDPALIVLRRAKRRAVVEIGAAIPAAVSRELEHACHPVLVAPEPLR
jgi:hypothetical protein